MTWGVHKMGKFRHRTDFRCFGWGSEGSGDAVRAKRGAQVFLSEGGGRRG